MSIDSSTELARVLEQALERASTGSRDAMEMGHAREEMNRLREELRREIGVVDVAVDLIHDARNS